MPFKLTDYLAYDFPSRHIGPSPQEMADMLKVIGYKTLDELIDDTVPTSIRQTEDLDWGPAMSERDALFYMREVAKQKFCFNIINWSRVLRHNYTSSNIA